VPVYLLTNKVTHSRLVIIADDEDAAKRVHPSNEFASRGRHDDGWHKHTGGHFGRNVYVEPPPGWPLDLSLVDAMLVARHYDYPGGGVLAYQDTTNLRHKGEGPDDSWGGYTLDRLRT
jgi:hypothetical protein